MTNVLLSCAHDKGVGGIQVMLRGSRQRPRNSMDAASISSTMRRCLGCGWSRRSIAWGRPAFYFPMPAIVKNSALLSVAVFLAYLPIAFVHLARLIHRKKIDVINCHYLTPYFIHLVIAARLLRVPVVVSVHGADIDGYAAIAAGCDRLVYRLIMRGADRIVACSDGHGPTDDRGVSRMRARRSPTCTTGSISRASSALPGRCAVPQPFLLCVCRHVHKKGVDTLLAAFALVRATCRSMSLVLVGGGPLLEENQALARTLQIEQQVVFTGNMAHADVTCFFAACTLFVLPSRAEPFGIVLLEAAYHKKGIVCTRVGGVPEIIADGFNGVLVEPDDPASMAAQIVALVRDPKSAPNCSARRRTKR